jgi:hypothetical protein
MHDRSMFGREHHDRDRGVGGIFFPFGAGRLILPLLLIGAGAWLLSGRGRGPRSGTGPSGQPGNQVSPPAAPAPAEPATGDDADPPVTGETRRL